MKAKCITNLQRLNLIDHAGAVKDPAGQQLLPQARSEPRRSGELSVAAAAGTDSPNRPDGLLY